MKWASSPYSWQFTFNFRGHWSSSCQLSGKLCSTNSVCKSPVSWLFIPPDILSPSTFTGKFLLHLLFRAKYKRFWKEGGSLTSKGSIPPLSALPHTDADRLEGAATLTEVETLRNQGQVTSGVFDWQDNSGPHTRSGRVPWPPKSLQHETFPTDGGGNWTMNYCYFYGSSSLEILKAPYLVNLHCHYWKPFSGCSLKQVLWAGGWLIHTP